MTPTPPASTLRQPTGALATPLGVAALGVIALWAFAWIVRRAFFDVEILANEGWNAYFADAVFGPAPLYPPRDQLITNNYPPLSFVVVGLLAPLAGDTVLAGRLISIASVVAITFWIAWAVRLLGGNRLGAVVAAAWFLATMARFFARYAGANEPQLLAHAIVGCGFVLFLRARAHGRSPTAAVLVMAAAGLVKHTVLAMPLAALMWLAVTAPRLALRQALIALAVLTGSLAACVGLFGHDFVDNMLLPRRFVPDAALGAIGHLQWTAVPLLVWLVAGWSLRGDAGARLASLLVAIAFVLFFVLKSGAGVGENAQFDLVIALAIALGLALAHAPPIPFLPRLGIDGRRALVLAALCLRLLATGRNEPVRWLFDPGFAGEVATREAALAALAAQARAAPGDVVCLTVLSCYRSGKPFTVDTLTVNERIAAHALPDDAVSARIASGRLTLIPGDPRASWSGRAD